MPDPDSVSRPAAHFATTRWTLVLAAGARPSLQADEALAELCRCYWYPLYAYVRRRGHSKEDAEDLTQSFFASFLSKNHLRHLAAEKGRFRAFLLASLKHFLANAHDRSQRLKRGGQATHLSLDWQSADSQFQLAGHADLNPEKIFDRDWALTLLGAVIRRLQDECARDGRTRHFETLKTFLTLNSTAISYSEAAQALGMAETAARVAVHRLRKRYRQILRDEIAHTLADPAGLEDELQALFAAFR